MKSFEDHPFQLAVGANTGPDDGFGCLMNVVSWMNGDSEITDQPSCTDVFLGGLCIAFNDEVMTKFGVPGRKSGECFLTELPIISNVATPAQAMRMTHIASLVMNTAVVDQGDSHAWRQSLIDGHVTGWGFVEELVKSSDTFDHAVDRFLAEVVFPFRTQFGIGTKENAHV